MAVKCLRMCVAQSFRDSAKESGLDFVSDAGYKIGCAETESHGWAKCSAGAWVLT